MLRVPIPIDLTAVISAGATVFALVTPIRVRTLLESAVVQALGARAPADKRERTLHATLAGLKAGAYSLELDGRLVLDLDAIVVCSGFATLRFFANRRSQVGQPEPTRPLE